MAMSNYENAIRALNGLQSNVAVLNFLKHRRQNRPETNIFETAKFLERTGVKVSDLDRLNVVHVAGTKGKGSVCAMTESILRHHGLKTGFYSSPHLIHVRERIRINGEPLSEEKFASYFWHVYDRLMETKNLEDAEEGFQSMPAYFKFLTIMAYHVFLAEKIDVAVVEVGIGGAYDCTNVIRNPVVCGITTLDYDHTGVLGDTLEQIAWQKGGIMKPNSVAVTMDQPQTSLDVLAQRSTELNCPLYLCPPLPTYSIDEAGVSALKLGIPGRQQMGNASLALQLARLWLLRRDDSSFLPANELIDVVAATASPPFLEPFPLTSLQAKALASCRWPGRSQTLNRGTTTFYIDGAHTPKSMELCAEWYRDVSADNLDNHQDIVRILIFNCTSDRKPESLLRFLVDSDFDCAIFCPNMIYTEVDAKSDQANMRVSHEKQMERCEESRRDWLSLHSKHGDYQEATDRLCGQFRENNRLLVSSSAGGGVAFAVSSDGTGGGGRTLINRFASEIDWRGHYPDASLEFTNFDYWTRSNGVCPSSNRVTAVFPCISSALGWVDVLEKQLTREPDRTLQVLVTGSLHLVGGVLSIVDPELKM